MLNKVIVEQNFNGKKIEFWLKNYFNKVPYSLLQKILRKKLIKINGKKAKVGDVLVAGSEIIFPIFLTKDSQNTQKKQTVPKNSDYKKYISNSILFENENIIAINKPFGLASQGGSKVKISVDNLFILHGTKNDIKPNIVHRLDKETTGVMLLAKTDYYTKYLAKLFKERQIEKIYYALVVGKLPRNKGVIDLPLSAKKSLVGATEKVYVDEHLGKQAITEYEVVSHKNNISLVMLKPLTGRTHQLRVHLSHLGNPILGDGKYGARDAFVDGFFDSIHLHCYKMTFRDENGKLISIKSEITKEFNEIFYEDLKKLGFYEF
jgi:23S rRNA pseudouridine955/2504/2580 synthase